MNLETKITIYKFTTLDPLKVPQIIHNSYICTEYYYKIMKQDCIVLIILVAFFLATPSGYGVDLSWKVLSAILICAILALGFIIIGNLFSRRKL